MKICSLTALNFRNLARQEISPGKRFNVISGDNGEGKSNLLELIDYLGTLSSFRGGKTISLIREDEKQSEFKASIQNQNILREHRVWLHRNERRKVTIDGKRPRSKYDYYRTVQMVIFHPDSSLIAAGSAEHRRNFLDRILEQLDPQYRINLTEYQRALRSRNRILKEERPDMSAISAYDELLASRGAGIGQARAMLISELSPYSEEAFGHISDRKITFSISYRPRVRPEYKEIIEALKKSLRKDMARGFTAEGPHGDDMALELKGINARNYASQGQNRAIVLALKIAELKEIEAKVGSVPVLLLDDVSSELDKKSSRRLFEIIGNLGGQVFLTTTHKEFILLEKDRVDFKVIKGVIEKQ